MKTHDISAKVWGKNYNVTRLLPKNRLDLVIWHSDRIEVEDYLILAEGEGTTRYRVEKVRYPGDPPDQCFVTAVFAPRGEE